MKRIVIEKRHYVYPYTRKYRGILIMGQIRGTFRWKTTMYFQTTRAAINWLHSEIHK